MKITIYELFGLIKDGKAPRKIVYDVLIWIYNKQDNDYYDENEIGLFSKYLDRCLSNCLDDEVEIIEDNKKIEKLDITEMFSKKKWKRDKYTWNKINEIIDKLNEIGDK